MLEANEGIIKASSKDVYALVCAARGPRMLGPRFSPTGTILVTSRKKIKNMLGHDAIACGLEI
jgi:hypothetical protein